VGSEKKKTGRKPSESVTERDGRKGSSRRGKEYRRGITKNN